jgi:hypothetical protein
MRLRSFAGAEDEGLCEGYQDHESHNICGGISLEVKNEEIVSQGVDALIERLGYANAVRFIALLGGRGDMTKTIRAKRDKGSLEEIVSRIQKKAKAAQS